MFKHILGKGSLEGEPLGRRWGAGVLELTAQKGL